MEFWKDGLGSRCVIVNYSELVKTIALKTHNTNVTRIGMSGDNKHKNWKIHKNLLLDQEKAAMEAISKWNKS